MTTSVLFVCVRNGGKSQMAAGLTRKAAGGRVIARSAGTDPGKEINTLSAEALAEVGVDISTETPKPIDPDLLRTVDVVVTLGRDARVDVPDGVAFQNWDTDEPLRAGHRRHRSHASHPRRHQQPSPRPCRGTDQSSPTRRPCSAAFGAGRAPEAVTRLGGCRHA